MFDRAHRNPLRRRTRRTISKIVIPQMGGAEEAVS